MSLGNIHTATPQENSEIVKLPPVSRTFFEDFSSYQAAYFLLRNLYGDVRGLDKRVERIGRNLERILEVFELKLSGLSTTQIVKKTGLYKAVVDRILADKLVKDLSSSNAFRTEISQLFPASVKTVDWSSWAFVFGAYAATSAYGRSSTQWCPVSREKEVTERFCAAIDRIGSSVTSLVLTGRSSDESKRLKIYDTKLNCILNIASCFNHFLPWPFLRTFEERAEFLRGYFGFSDVFCKEGIEISPKICQRFMVELATLIESVMNVEMIVPKFTKTSGAISLRGRGPIEFILDRKLFIGSNKLARAEQMLKMLPETDKNYLAYRQAMQIHQDNPAMSIAEVARRVGESSHAVYAWLRGISVPFSEMRKRELVDLRRSLGVPERLSALATDLIPDSRRVALVNQSFLANYENLCRTTQELLDKDRSLLKRPLARWPGFRQKF